MIYAELGATTNFSFLRGASHPEEFARHAKALGHAAIGIADRASFAGIVRAHVAAKAEGIKLLVGARLDPADGPPLRVFARDKTGYAALSRAISLGRRRAGHGGDCALTLDDLVPLAGHAVVLALEPRNLGELRARFGAHTYLALARRFDGRDEKRLAELTHQARQAKIRAVATNDAHYHAPERRALQDVLSCVREGTTIDRAGYRLAANAERHLKTPEEMARLFRAYPDALAAIADIVAACDFSLDELRYTYPELPDAVPGTSQATLERLAREGAKTRYPEGVPAKVTAQIEHELRTIAQLGYAPYFLTVHDIVVFARARGILCQGRGSAANSAVCYCLGITAVNPARLDLLFERFVSAARDEPPDIDVDFEHERREEVIQFIYERYGRERAGLAATVISYRSRSALRDVGKALGLSADAIQALSGTIWGRSNALEDRHIREAGLDPDEPRLRLALDLARQLKGFPRHLSQHVGGFVIARGRLDELCPVVDAAMDARTIVEWDKDDLDALGILKIDVLALGMLTCIRKAFAMIEGAGGPALDLATVPAEDPAVYDMLCEADSVGVFQIESRAQMSMLPRLKPRNFYDLVIEVAIVRPGPIQGDMVHPDLRRRNGEEAVVFPSRELEAVLGKTLGVPLFQEQAMKIAIVAAGFTPVEADALRRAMATFKKTGLVHTFREKFVAGMIARGYAPAFAERCFRQIEGFGNYGFPESHAASFALLVYVSSWLKRHHPAAFAGALLNSQPMGFYAPAQIVRDARDHGVAVHPPCVVASDWDSTLETPNVLRLGLRQIKGLSESGGRELVARRPAQGWRAPGELAFLSKGDLEALAKGDAFAGTGLARRPALWRTMARGQAPLPLFASLAPAPETAPPLPDMGLGEAVALDYSHLRLSLKAHPVALLRPALAKAGLKPCSTLATAAAGSTIRLAGLVLVRQRPGTASGVIFMTLEDETGIANLVVWPTIFERFRSVVLGARLLVVRGQVQREGKVIHVIARALESRDALLGPLASGAYDGAIARADEVRRPGADARLFPSRDFH
ncbi:MAG: error-prone DNA polymerase [Tagaea sp.]